MSEELEKRLLSTGHRTDLELEAAAELKAGRERIEALEKDTIAEAFLDRFRPSQVGTKATQPVDTIDRRYERAYELEQVLRDLIQRAEQAEAALAKALAELKAQREEIGRLETAFAQVHKRAEQERKYTEKIPRLVINGAEALAVRDKALADVERLREVSIWALAIVAQHYSYPMKLAPDATEWIDYRKAEAALKETKP